MAKEFIVYSSTKAKFKAQVANGTIDATQIGIIGDTAEVWINGAYHPIAPLLDYAKRSEVVAGYLPKNALSVEPSEHNFTWRVATGDSKLTDSLAVVNKLLGRTVKWNQMIGSLASTTTRGLDISYSSGVITMALQKEETKLSPMSASFGSLGARLTKGRTYLLTSTHPYKGVGIREGSNGTFRQANNVFTVEANSTAYFALSSDFIFDSEFLWSDTKSKYSTSALTMKFNLFDLTEMFGSGNEPQSLGEFRKLYPKAYYAPCITPQTVGVKIEALPLASYNLWNKDEAVQGAIMYDTGWMRSDAYYKNWWTYIIPVAPNTRYYLLNVANRSQCMPCVYYGEDMTQLRDTNGNVAEGISHAGPQSLVAKTESVSGEVLTPADAAYMAVMVHNTYKGKACVSVSSRRNGETEAYIESGTPLYAISELEDADGNELFPHGLLATADGVADEVGEGYALQRVTYDTAADGTISNLRQVEIVNSAGNTVKGFKYSPINTRLWMTWRVRRGATEKVTLSDVSAPFRASISYALDVNDLLPAPLLEDVGGGTILTYNDLTRTPFRSTKTISQNWDSIQRADKNMITTGEDVYLAILRLRHAATGPAMPIEEVNTMDGATLIANVVSVLNGSSTVCYIKELVASVSTDGSIYNDVWILRAPISPGTTFKSDVKINWKNNQKPTFTATSAVYEIKIQHMPYLGYIGEWSAYYLTYDE